MSDSPNLIRPEGVEPGDSSMPGAFLPIGTVPIRTTKTQAEELVRMLTGGGSPDDGDTVKFSLTGWVFTPLQETEIPVSRLADGAARQLLQTDAAGTGVEWTSIVAIPGYASAQAFLDDLVLQLPSGDATPDVGNHQVWKTLGTTTITDFDNGVPGQTLFILAQASITIADNANIVLAGSANYNMTVGDTLVLKMFDAGVWSELSRSVN